ncbi:efflux RND transporter periplasmic adaptor subunit [Legionella quateirensis]|uniref:Membrane-fusion protein involved in transport n=1 Tax=Legionella quateirensis TaxID=45072 RepID=A0A378KSK4_9GAMM|nr:efflux RND transporter periplasmic adaptor subunit [Legionella quateirensis]KTD43685.1 membrane-fusion protein involved in transport [Legionella quateirensis]STY17326.1 membrane-fusion protein involved in transport [Legionella quateirensis]
MLKGIKYQFKEHKSNPLFVFLVLFLMLFLTVIVYRVYSAIILRQQTRADEVNYVRVLTATPLSGTERIILPGNVQAWHDATIYARTNGYIKNWYVDIGSHVKKGDLLAVIETPELDAQLRQAEADLNTAIANNQIAQSTAKRWVNLVKSNSVSKQERDEKVSDAASKYALEVAARANVDRLKELVSFERVIAPFDGVITSRTTDIGSLINAGSSDTGLPLFQIAQTNPLRIYVKIPQNYSSRITPDMKVSLTFAEHPGQTFPAQLIKTAQAIDPATRTLLAQFKAENSNEELLAGGYTKVTFTFTIPKNTFRLPVNTLLFQAQGLQIAVVDKNNQVVLKPITISRDFGDVVEIDEGINAGEKIILNPSDSIINGEHVKVVS